MQNNDFSFNFAKKSCLVRSNVCMKLLDLLKHLTLDNEDAFYLSLCRFVANSLISPNTVFAKSPCLFHWFVQQSSLKSCNRAGRCCVLLPH